MRRFRSLRGRLPTGGGMAAIVALVAVLLAAVPLAAQPVGAPLSSPQATAGSPLEPVLEAPSATGSFGEPLTFSTTFTAGTPPERVELMTREPGARQALVRLAQVSAEGGGRYRATLADASHVVPNTTLLYRFRVVTPTGTVLGPESRLRVDDDRLDWRTLSGERVSLHWHEGSEGFARRALEIAESAVDAAADLLGVETVDPVDLFVYADGEAFREALGPGTREQVGGQANTDIRTLFGLIRPSQIESSWVEELVRHELTHLVFDDAVDNPWHYPPRWLNEGLAVYLSTGYTSGDRAQVEAAARNGTIMPLEALVGQFPTTPRRFSLAYAISVSAVDHLVRTHGQDRLVRLITSYANGVSDDEAFRDAIGMDFAAFDDAWLASVGAERPRPFGPRPEPPGPLPSAWREQPPDLLP